MKIAVCGACGRMGISIIRAAIERGHTISAALDSAESQFMGKDISVLISSKPVGIKFSPVSAAALDGSDAVIDFSSIKGIESLLEATAASKTPIVIGTTGFSFSQKDFIQSHSASLPIVLSPNMSVGVNILFKLTAMASRALEGFDTELFEAHHRFKKDAPSGTAVRLIEIIKENSNTLARAAEIHGREGITGERADAEIGIHAMRGGDIVGEHTVFFNGIGERIELTHRATDRAIFARGAVVAAEFLAKKTPGMYTMFDVLGIS